MAEPNSTHSEARKSHRLVPTAQLGFPMPKVKFPSRLAIPENGIRRPEFEIKTNRGSVRVECTRAWLRCFGTPEALAEAAMLHPSWLPGLPGNNKSRQTVLFTDRGPFLALGKTPAYGKNPETRNAHIGIAKKGKKYTVELYVTEEQSLQLAHVWEEQDRRDEEKRKERVFKDAEKHVREMHSDPKSSMDFMKSLIGSASTSFNGRLFEYTPETTARIREALEELQQAIAEAKILEAPKYERIGDNVLSADFRKAHATASTQ